MRRLIPLEPPEAAFPHYLLAEALAGIGEPENVVRPAVQQYLDHVATPARPRESAQAMAALAVLRGDFAAAEERYEDLERLPEALEDLRFAAVYPRVLLNLELGRSAKAIRVAEGYMRERAGLSPSEMSGSITVQAAERSAGGLTHEAFVAARDRWLAQNRDAEPGFRWIEAYARPAETREEADEALAVMPDMRAMVIAMGPDLAEPVGRAFVLAGRLDEALPYLVRATASCAILSGVNAITSTRPRSSSDTHSRIAGMCQARAPRIRGCSRAGGRHRRRRRPARRRANEQGPSAAHRKPPARSDRCCSRNATAVFPPAPCNPIPATTRPWYPRPQCPWSPARPSAATSSPSFLAAAAWAKSTAHTTRCSTGRSRSRF